MALLSFYFFAYTYVDMKQQIKVIQLIHGAFCTAVLIFGLVSLFINKGGLHFAIPKKTEDLVFVLVAVLSVVFGNILFKKLIGSIGETNPADQKLMQYQTAFLVKCAFFEAGALANIIAFLMSANTFFLLFAGLCFIFLVMSKPTPDKVAESLRLQDSDIL